MKKPRKTVDPRSLRTWTWCERCQLHDSAAPHVCVSAQLDLLAGVGK